MTVRVTENFYDMAEDGKLRTIGEELEVDEKKADILVIRGLAEIIQKPAGGDQPKKKPAKQNQ